jgi:hypothetical protein
VESVDRRRSILKKNKRGGSGKQGKRSDERERISPFEGRIASQILREGENERTRRTKGKVAFEVGRKRTHANLWVEDNGN